MCTALEQAGVEDESCREAAALREALEARTDDRRIVAELLGAPVEDMELRPNLVENGGFEEWDGANPAGWRFGAYLGPDGDGGLYVAGEDALGADGEAARISTLRGGLLPDGTATYAEYAGNEFPITDTKYLLSLSYCLGHFTEGSGLVFVGDYAHSDGLVLVHHGLPPSNSQWHTTRILVDGPAMTTSVMPLVRNWGVGDMWVRGVKVRPVIYAEEPRK